MGYRTWITTVLTIAVVASAACTFDEGTGFARLSATLQTHFDSHETDGWLETDLRFELKLDKFLLRLGGLDVVGAEVAEPTSGCSFDPSKPPSGCANCHGGHCHCGDALVSYADLEAQVCGSSSGAASVLAQLPVGEVVDLLDDGPARELLACRPSCELGTGQITAAQVSIEQLQLVATLRDANQPDRLGGELRLEVSLALQETKLSHVLAEPALLDRDHDYERHLQLELSVGATLFDRIDWSALDRDDETLEVDDDHNTTTAVALRGNFVNASGLTIQHEHEHEHDQHEHDEHLHEHN